MIFRSKVKFEIAIGNVIVRLGLSDLESQLTSFLEPLSQLYIAPFFIVFVRFFTEFINHLINIIKIHSLDLYFINLIFCETFSVKFRIKFKILSSNYILKLIILIVFETFYYD